MVRIAYHALLLGLLLIHMDSKAEETYFVHNGTEFMSALRAVQSLPATLVVSRANITETVEDFRGRVWDLGLLRIVGAVGRQRPLLDLGARSEVSVRNRGYFLLLLCYAA